MEVTYLDGEQESVNFVSRAGRARVVYANGDVYEGPFDDRRVKHGSGASYSFRVAAQDEDGALCDLYSGDYADGAKSGVGKMLYANGERYAGEWRRGLRHGTGSYTYRNKDIYSGAWKDDKRHGQGTYVFEESGCQLQGEWDAGKLSSGVFRHPDGTAYTGNFKSGNLNGEVNIQLSNGLSISGEFYERLVAGRPGQHETRWLPSSLSSGKGVDENISKLEQAGAWP